MTDGTSVFLSFFALSLQEFQFNVFRRRRQKGETREDFPDHISLRLPLSISKDNQSKKYFSYWVGFEPLDGFQEVTCFQHVNPWVTVEYLYHLLKVRCEEVLSKDAEFMCESKGFRRRRISFVLMQYDEGKQIVWLEPYFLKSKNLFGFLVDFRFNDERDGIVTTRTLKLSLSLDKRGRSNRNFYVDRYARIREFVSKYGDRVFNLGAGVMISPLRCNLEVKKLNTKRYLFAKNRTKNSQFLGIKEYGPLDSVGDAIRVHFLFREQDRSFSNSLFRALRGDREVTRFPGMERMFGYRFDSSNVGGTALQDFTVKHIQTVLETISNNTDARPVVPIFVSPYDKYTREKSKNLYFAIKLLCLKNNIPSQFVSIPLLRQSELFEWAVSNIALQLFAKMGGTPWIVEPETRNCLIIGIGQAHKRQNGIVKKFFAYSILTESTGLYKELKILGNTSERSEYVEHFKGTLSAVLSHYHDKYNSFVLHTPFSIRRDELEAIHDAIESARSDASDVKEFVVLKFNDRNKFFAYSSSGNSMVPYESTYVALSEVEYLVWFEGLQYHKPTVGRKIGRPLHVEFIYPRSGLSDEKRREYLQDALNISGANWRGFNAKSLPISMFYAQLVAQFYKEFPLSDLEDVNLEMLSPWFL